MLGLRELWEIGRLLHVWTGTSVTLEVYQNSLEGQSYRI